MNYDAVSELIDLIYPIRNLYNIIKHKIEFIDTSNEMLTSIEKMLSYIMTVI